MTITLDEARRILEAQPFSRWLGATLVRFGPDAVDLQLPVSGDMLQQHGFVHGGVLSYAADNALTFAGGLALGPSVVTAEFKINYLRPAKGTMLVARARVIHAGRSQAVTGCEIFSVGESGETLCAAAQGTIALLAKPG